MAITIRAIETDESTETRRRVPRLWLLALCALVLAALLPRPGYGLSVEDQRFARYLIDELRYFDTARRWLNGLKAKGGLSDFARAEIDSRLIDILQAEGKQDEALKALERFKKNHPAHPRASLGSLEVIGASFGNVVLNLEKATIESDQKKAVELRSEASTVFENEVMKRLGFLIASLEKEVKDGKDESKKRLLYQAELSRIKLLLNYAKLLPDGSKERKTALEEGLKHATRFVDVRYEFYVMQYDAQIQKGLFLLELGRHDEAGEELSLLYDIGPPVDPDKNGRHPEALVRAFKTIRLQAILFGARALNAAGRYDDAIREIRNNVLRATADPLSINIKATQKDTVLAKFAMLARLEYGIALAGSGDAQKGLDEVHGVIEGTDDQGLVNDARAALGRIASSKTVALTGRDYYQAGIGLKGALKFNAARATFSTALTTLAAKDVPEYAPLCLKEIGEISFIQGRFVESALAYEDLVTLFPAHELARKGAQNFLAAITKAQERPGGTAHAGLARLRALADRKSDELSPGQLSKFQALMVDGRRLEEEGKFAEAREKYLQVPKESETEEGKPPEKVPFYWRAQASVWSTWAREWEQAKGEEKEKFAPKLDEGVVALGTILKGALADGERVGAELAVLTLGQIHNGRGEWQESVAALKMYLGELQEDTVFRCSALYYLVDAATNADEDTLAVEAYRALGKACTDASEGLLVSRGAFFLAEYFTAKGKNKRAGVFMYEYVNHPSTELTTVAELLHAAQILTDGGFVDKAAEMIEKARELTTAKGGAEGEAELERQLQIMEARSAASQGDHAGAIEKFEAYIQRYKAIGNYYDDPYVRRELAEAYLKAGGKEIPTANLLKAEVQYSQACRILKTGLDNAPNPKIDQLYWRWAYRWMAINYLRGKKDRVGYGRVYQFWKINRHEKMGGAELKAKFEKLYKLSRSKLLEKKSGK